MPRLHVFLFAILAFTPLACRLPPEREALRSIPEDGAGLIYNELIVRGRAQLNLALDAFYLDSWKELEEMGKGLEQTARFLPKSAEPPTTLKDNILTKSKEMRNSAIRLSEGARTKNVEMCSEALRDLNLQIRALRVTEAPK